METIAFTRYRDDDTELELELPVEVHMRLRGRYEPEVRVEGEYDRAWDPAAEQWVALTDAEQNEASELIAEFEREQQFQAEADAASF